MKSQMRTTISFSVWLFLLGFGFLFNVQAVHAESIESFHALIEVQSNGELFVIETVRYDFGSNDRHGIYREVASRHPQKASSIFHERYIEPIFNSVSRNGNDEGHLIQDGYDGMSVRIGDPERTITGLHEYTIRYSVSGAISTYDGQPELYWNVTGDEWSVPMEEVSVTLKAVGGAKLLAQTVCYGPQCEFTNQGESTMEFVAGPLAPGQQLTIAQQVYLPQEPIVLERITWTLIASFLMVLLVLTLGFKTYRWRTEHKFNKPVVAQYEPYQDFKPMFTGVLLDNRLDPEDITAGIVFLAQQGFITIKQTTEKVLFLFDSHDYEVTLKRPLSETSSSFQVDLLMLLFYGQQVATDKSKLFSFKFHSLTLDPSKNEMKVGKTIRLSEVKANNSKQRSNLKLIKQLKKDVEKDLVEQGFIEQRMSRSMKGWLVGGSVFVLFFGFQAVSFVSFEFFIIAFLGAIVLMVTIGFSLERRTQKGYEALNHLKGFKDFLSTTEKERYAFHNAPDKNPEQFMEYLPYAIAFKVEKEWAEVFKDVQIGNPDWYQTDVPGAHFSAVAFSNEIGSFSSSLASSGGSSGSSGGGSAGGGAGGGGGGSW